ncbi:MAG: hypothetical protein ACRD3P_17985 [Terriglobales bacterium]
MFGNRKRKLQDEEESLVPHGLIWHATEEPTPEEVAKSEEESLGYTLNYAQEIDRARREQSLTPIDETPHVAPQAPPEKPWVLPWWRLEPPTPTIEPPKSKLAPMPLSAYVPTAIGPAVEPARPSRIQPMQIRPTPVEPINVQPASPPTAVQPIQAIPITTPIAPAAQVLQASTPHVEGSMARSVQVRLSPTPESMADNPPASKLRVEERLIPNSSEISESMALAFSRLRSAGKTAWLGLRLAMGMAVQRGRQTVRSLGLREGLERAGKQGQNLLRGGIIKTRHYARTTGSALSAFSRSGASRVQQMSARVRSASTATNGDVVRPANTRPSTPSRVRVLLATSALQARIITAQRLSAWRLRRERMAIDSRFWPSMTMAAIVAIIALVIVSIVPHYAARSLPSRILNTNPSVDASVATPVAATPAPVHKSDALVRKSATGTQTTASKTDSAQTNSAKVGTNSPKPKHVVHDDYVAPNTYKYYGAGSKSSR